MAGLVCDIVTPEKKLFSGEATLVAVPGTEGQMGFLHGHVPLVSALADGVVRVTNDEAEDGAKAFACQGGYVEVDGEKVIVLADRAVLVDDIDAAAVQSELAQLEQKLSGVAEGDVAAKAVATDIAWCNTRLAAIA